MMHTMKLFKSAFERIKARSKKIEVRLNDKKCQKLKVGDTIKFTLLDNPTETIETKILDLESFPSFEALLNKYDLSYYGHPEDYSSDKFIEGCYKIWPKEKVEKYGVLAIKIELL